MLAMLAWLAAASAAAALERDRAMSQYIRDEWGSARGYPGGAVHAIAQSRDGYLWIAAERGLVRFDGLKFELIESSPAATGGGTSILGVAAAPEGGIWARPAGPALFAVRDGVQTDLLKRHNLRPSAVTAMTTGRDGVVLDVLHTERPPQLSPGTLHSIGRRARAPGQRRPRHRAGG